MSGTLRGRRQSTKTKRQLGPMQCCCCTLPIDFVRLIWRFQIGAQHRRKITRRCLLQPTHLLLTMHGRKQSENRSSSKSTCNILCMYQFMLSPILRSRVSSASSRGICQTHLPGRLHIQIHARAIQTGLHMQVKLHPRNSVHSRSLTCLRYASQSIFLLVHLPECCCVWLYHRILLMLLSSA